MTEPLVAIEAMTKRFGDAGPAAIDGLTTAIRAGQVTGLVGPDGAGKTTLMRLMAALLAPSEGRITVCGFDTATRRTEIHDTIGYMPQRFGLYEDLSVIENLDSTPICAASPATRARRPSTSCSPSPTSPVSRIVARARCRAA